MDSKKIYIKDESHDPIYRVRSGKFLVKSRILPLTLILGGILILGTQVILPLAFFKSTKKSNATIMESSVLGVMSGFKDFEFEELLSEDGETKVAENIDRFYLTIPKLDIEKAVVEVNSTSMDPKNSLGHYAGSALPGQPGNSFIYGHSVLPWFFNPKNYKTIFSTLEKLEVGDELIVESGDHKFTYLVENKETLYPAEVNPLEETKPTFLNESTVTLMTCIPPGTKLKRLLVHAVKTN